MKGTEGITVLKPPRQSPSLSDPSGVSGSASCALPARYDAVKSARDFTGVTLSGWGLSAHFDNVGLVVSELVTNALRHGLPDDAPTAEEPPVRLHLMRWTSRLVCAVRDPSSAAPVARIPDFQSTVDELAAFDLVGRGDGATDEDPAFPDAAPSGESGRGLFLVDSFSDSWGWQPLSGDSDGKVVWALFRLSMPS